jgi:hypothetical protein
VKIITLIPMQSIEKSLIGVEGQGAWLCLTKNLGKMEIEIYWKC